MPVGAIARDDASAEFFDATARGELLVRRCDGCGQFLPPPSEQCSGCHGTALSWSPVAGGAQVVSWSVVRGRDVDPVVVGLVELDEGPWLHGQLVDADPAAVAVGVRLAVGFERPEGGEAVPVFRLE